MTKPKPRLTMEALAKAMEPPNNCRVRKFINEYLDADSREVFESALKLDKTEFPASAISNFLIDSGFDPEVIPSDGAIQDHPPRRPAMQVPRMTDTPKLTMEGLEESLEQESLRETVQRLERQLADAKKKTDKLVAATLEGAKDGFLIAGPMPPVPVPNHDSRSHSAEVALWDLGDWQGAKETTTYNSEVMRERVLRFCDVATRITEMHRSDHPVRQCVVVFGGDMIEGLWNFPTQPHEVDATIFGQYATVSRLLIDVVRRALGTYESVKVVAEWGNHGRMGSKRDAVPRSDNVDRMCFEFARTMLSDEERLEWDDCPEDIQRLEVGNYRAIVIHGDEVGRGGYASPATFVQHVAKWQSGAYPWSFRDAYVHHYHVHQEFALPNGLGSVYYTGSTESDNRYALTTMASSASPTQRLHFIDPEAGRVVSAHKIWLVE